MDILKVSSIVVASFLGLVGLTTVTIVTCILFTVEKIEIGISDKKDTVEAEK